MYNIKYLDLIGKNIKIENSSDVSKINIKGLVIYETKNIVVIKNKFNKIKKIKKQEILKLTIMWFFMDKSKISVRGKLFEGQITKMKAKNTAHIIIKQTKYIPKYERYLVVRKVYPVHVPDGLDVAVGDMVLCGETRKLSKTKSKIIIRKLTEKEIKNIEVEKSKETDVVEEKTDDKEAGDSEWNK